MERCHTESDIACYGANYAFMDVYIMIIVGVPPIWCGNVHVELVQ